MLTTILGGSVAGFPSVMTQYCLACRNEMAEAGLFGPAVPTVSEAGSTSPAAECTSLDGTPTGQPLLGPCAASLLNRASNVAKGTAMVAEASATGPAAPAHDLVASPKGGGYGRRRPTSPESA